MAASSFRCVLEMDGRQVVVCPDYRLEIEGTARRSLFDGVPLPFAISRTGVSIEMDGPVPVAVLRVPLNSVEIVRVSPPGAAEEGGA